jgi:pimeloyl-ACP methyl ester carboxylesterase
LILKKNLIHFLSSIFPNLFVSITYKQLTTPQVHKNRAHEIKSLAKSKQKDFTFENFTIKTYQWGSGLKSVLLIHGWEGQAGNFADLVEVLVENNFTVYAFDGPGHGASSLGGTSLFKFSDLVGALIKKHNINNLVSHSFGGVATSVFLGKNPQITIERYVLFTTPNKFEDRIQFVADSVGISKKVTTRLINKIEKEEGIEVSKMNVAQYAQKSGVKKALILHDTNDRVLSVKQSKQVSRFWRNSTLEEVTGTGHYRILRTKSILIRAVEFLNS